MINKDKLKEYIEAFRKPPNPSIQYLSEIQDSLERVELELIRTQAILINIAKSLGVEIPE
jgi:hypothetical protein